MKNKNIFLGSIISILTIAIITYFSFPEKKEIKKTEIKTTAKTKEELFKTKAKFPHIKFTEIARESGINFNHISGAYGEKFLPEATGGGLAVIDFDNDGDQDLFFVNSAYLRKEDFNKKGKPISKFFENDGKGTFKDITKKLGLDISVYGQGVAVGDIDNDGFDDIFITALGKNLMLKNNNGKSFVNITEKSGVAGNEDAWTVAAGFSIWIMMVT